MKVPSLAIDLAARLLVLQLLEPGESGGLGVNDEEVMFAGATMRPVSDVMVGVMDRHTVHAKRGKQHRPAQQQLELRRAMEMRFGDKSLYFGPRGLRTTIRTIEDELALHSLAIAAVDVFPGNLLEVRDDVIIRY